MIRKLSLFLGLLLSLSGCLQQPLPLEPTPSQALRSTLNTTALGGSVLADFEGGAPTGFFVFNGASTVTTTPVTVAAGDPLARPGQTADQGVLETRFQISDFGGFGQDLSLIAGGPQDWRDFDAIGFWFHGANSGLAYQVEIQDNRSDPNSDTAERWDVTFTDDFTGWRFLTFPFSVFTRATDFQPGGAPDDGLGLTEVWGWAIVLPVGSGSFYLDNVSLLGGEIPLRVGFSRPTYTAQEGARATIGVALTRAAETEVRVDYATQDGTATAGQDYLAASGTLVFAPGETLRSFEVETLEDDLETGPVTLTLTLSNAQTAELGSLRQATLTIEDNDFRVPETLSVVEDFESGLPTGRDRDDNPLGFFTFQDPNSAVAIRTTPAPEAVPGSPEDNEVLVADLNVAAFAGFVQTFGDEALTTWEPQDWSAFEGIGFWFYGTGSGTSLFFDILDNRNPGSSRDDAERYSVAFPDNFTGWRFLTLPFASFTRKEIGNGAPNDGLGLTEVHGWAFGALGTGGSRTFYLDDVSLYGTAPFRPLSVSFTSATYDIPEGSRGEITVRLNRAIGEEDPASVTVSYVAEPGTALPGRNYEPVSGSLTFVRGGETTQSFSLPTLADGKYTGDLRVVLRLVEPQGAELGFLAQASAFVRDRDPFDPTLIDDFERGAYLWDAENAELSTPELEPGDALAVPGQGRFESVLAVKPTATLPTVQVKGNGCNRGNGILIVEILSDATFDATTLDHTTLRYGGAAETQRHPKTGAATRRERDVNGDGRRDLVLHVRARDVAGACGGTPTLTGRTLDGVALGAGTAYVFRDFPIAQDWTGAAGLEFWYYGAGDGRAVTVLLKGSRAPDPGPSGWELVWSDEFNEPAGSPPNPENWTFEIGDVTPDGKNGWGNDELQYYTDDPANAATDGQGNLVITVREADGELQCYYGPCRYTSARLLSWHKAEFAYGRIEARVQVPQGAGLWPAFWSLGTDIDRVSWPQSGEIDIMEFVGRLPNEIYGTIHGPGYEGGRSFGRSYDLGRPVYGEFHTYAVEWQPDRIVWYFGDIQYHQAVPADVAPNEWVFNHPFFLLLNMAVGGNFGGPVGADTTFPQSMKVDYVRVYQAPDTAERFQATFEDAASGWQRVQVPFSAFTRSDEQPEGAPEQGLDLSDIWGYGFRVPGSTPFYLDQVRLR